jgi:hypothetical protein
MSFLINKIPTTTRKSLNWFLAIILLAVTLAISIFVFYKIQESYESTPKLVLGINGIKLGDKKSDTLFMNPGFDIAIKKDQPIILGGEEYFNASTKTTIEFANNLVAVIRYGCGNIGADTKINGISCGDRGEKIIEKYKNYLRIQCLKESAHEEAVSYRVYDVSNYGIRHLLKNNSVAGFIVASPEKLLEWTGKNWITCS